MGSTLWVIGAAAVLAVLGHGCARKSWTVRQPRAGITALVVVSVLIPATLLLCAASALIAVSNWASGSPGGLRSPSPPSFAAWTCIGLSLGVTLLVVRRVHSRTQVDSEHERELRSGAETAGRHLRSFRGIPVLAVDHGDSVVSLGGPQGPLIVASAPVLELLSDEQFDAVLAHEHAHIHCHHGSLQTYIGIVRDLLPGPLGGYSLSRHGLLLIELLADDAAVRTGYRRQLTGALAIIGLWRSDESLLLRAERLLLPDP